MPQDQPTATHPESSGAEPAHRPTTMTAVVRDRYGVDHVEVRSVPTPDIGDDEVLVRMHASSINAADWHLISGDPFIVRFTSGIMKPKNPICGADFAGVVEAVGRNVERFAPGDRVFGEGRGVYAEYAALSAKWCARIPDGVSFEQAGAIGIAGLTALQGLRDHGELVAGQHVLVNGASGGVGTYAVQIAKALGAEVTAVCRTRNVAMVRDLGADHIVDYTSEDVTRGTSRFDVVLDVAGNRSLRDLRRVMKRDGVLVVVGAQKKTGLVGPLGRMLRLMVAGRLVSQKVVFFVAKSVPEDLATLGEFLRNGEVHSVIERTVGLDGVQDAIRDQGAGHARAKTAIVVDHG